MQENLLSLDYSKITFGVPAQLRRGYKSILVDGVIAGVWTLLLGIPLFFVFLLLIYYELFLHGVEASFSVFHVLGKAVPIHLVTMLIWSGIFWTAAFSIRRFFEQRKQLLNTQEWLSNSRTQALTDALTGIWNRRGFDLLLETGLERARNLNQPYTLLLADVNRFKQYNDTHGHLAGDQALQQITHTLVDTVRAEDAVARYGGDEFAILCPGLEWHDAVALMRRLHASCSEKTPLALSIGAAVFPADGDCHIRLMEVADKRLYQAKKRLANNVPSAH